MSNNEFSSVEWLYHKMVIKLCNKLQTIEYAHLFLEELEQAKAMHEEEIVNAVDGFPIHTRHMDGEEYYYEIFGGNNENNN